MVDVGAKGILRMKFDCSLNYHLWVLSRTKFTCEQSSVVRITDLRAKDLRKGSL